jgi:hypothetical protein
MNMTTKKDIFGRYLAEYLRADKQRKGEILKTVCDITLMHKKAAIRKFKKLQMRRGHGPEKRGRKIYYTPDVSVALRTVWKAGSEICGELLHPIIEEYVTIFQRDNLWRHSKETTDKLLEMSEATTKRRVGEFMKSRIAKKGKSATNPSNLKEIIPIFTGPWKDKPAGYGQIDTVVHCGNSLVGDLVYSVNYTDVALLWVSFSAQWNKGQTATRDSLERIKDKTPFPIKGMHPDTGSEFINWVLKKWCDEESVELTRSRPNHKNDNAYVEQKNGHVIRRFLGYSRLDHREVVRLINEMYDLLEIYLNHFVPSKKLIEKVRIGSRYKRKYEKAKTAYRRVLADQNISLKIKTQLMKEHNRLNPLILKKKIDVMIEEIFTINRLLREPKSEI